MTKNKVSFCSEHHFHRDCPHRHGLPIRLQINTVSDITTVIPKPDHPKLDPIQIKATNVSRNQVEPIGSIKCLVSITEKFFDSRYYVAQLEVTLVGLD